MVDVKTLLEGKNSVWISSNESDERLICEMFSDQIANTIRSDVDIASRLMGWLRKTSTLLEKQFQLDWLLIHSVVHSKNLK